MGWLDFVSDLTDVVTQPLGLSSSSSENQLKRNQQDLQGIALPELKNLNLDTNFLRYVKSLSPTELKKIQENPQLLQAQMGALNKLGDITAGNGLSVADRGRIGQIGQEEAIREQGQRQALQQNAQARGLGGSGLEAASLLSAQQGSANRASNRDIDVESLAQQRALQAIQAQGNLSGNIRNQNYGQAANAASAQDVINQFNVSGQNAARLAGANLRNQQNIYNTQQLPQTRYANQMDRFNVNSGLSNQIAGAKDDRTSSLFSNAVNIGAGIATGGASLAAQGGLSGNLGTIGQSLLGQKKPEEPSNYRFK